MTAIEGGADFLDHAGSGHQNPLYPEETPRLMALHQIPVGQSISHRVTLYPAHLSWPERVDDSEHVERTVEAVREGKKFLYAQLEALGYKAIRTQTIFVTVEVGKGVKALIEALRERKVKVREAFDMEGYMRISVGLPRENEAVIEELKRIPRPTGG